MKRRVLIGLLALVFGLLHLQVFWSNWGQKVELSALDLWFNLRGPIEAPSELVILSMDESSYRVLDLPMDQAWPRSLHAQVLEKLSEYQAKKVVMDILFLGESSNKDADLALAQAISKNKTVLAADLGSRQEASAAGTFILEELLQPLDSFMQNAESIALAKLPEDQGYVRRFFIPETSVSKETPILFQAAIDPDIFKRKSENPGQRDFINYYGPPATISTYPIHQLLNPKGPLPKNLFKDKIVFIGLNLRTELGPAQKDSFLTPFYQRGRMFGVEIQAQAAGNLINKDWIKRSSAASENIALFIITAALACIVLFSRPLLGGAVVAGIFLCWGLISYLSFSAGFYLPGAILSLILLPVVYLGSTLIYYFKTYKEQQQSEKAFQMYLSPEMSKLMRSNQDSLKLGGESLYATALFTDIEGFTSITEKMTASEVSNMLNAYFTEVMDTVLENRGTLIKFIGDAIFALWGAPIKEADHARLACETAINIQKEVQKFNESKRFPALNTRVGINTGTMVVGNLGSKRRFDYTAIGDSVNLASRLEALNKYFGTQILVSENVFKESSQRIPMLDMGRIAVSGKNDAVQVYSIFTPNIAEDTKTLWENALVKFRNRSWTEAADLFLKASQQDIRLDKSAKLYIHKIEEYLNNSPAESWNGQITFDSK